MTSINTPLAELRMFAVRFIQFQATGASSTHSECLTTQNCRTGTSKRSSNTTLYGLSVVVYQHTHVEPFLVKISAHNLLIIQKKIINQDLLIPCENSGQLFIIVDVSWHILHQRGNGTCVDMRAFDCMTVQLRISHVTASSKGIRSWKAGSEAQQESNERG